MRIVDLGCGNGIVGLSAAVDVAAEFGPTEVIAVDDSALAIDATKRSWKATGVGSQIVLTAHCLLYTSPSPRDATLSRMPSSA